MELNKLMSYIEKRFEGQEIEKFSLRVDYRNGCLLVDSLITESLAFATIIQHELNETFEHEYLIEITLMTKGVVALRFPKWFK